MIPPGIVRARRHVGWGEGVVLESVGPLPSPQPDRLSPREAHLRRQVPRLELHAGDIASPSRPGRLRALFQTLTPFLRLLTVGRPPRRPRVAPSRPLLGDAAGGAGSADRVSSPGSADPPC